MQPSRTIADQNPDQRGLITVDLRTDAWRTDKTLHLAFPSHWDVTTLWPDTPRPLTDAEIGATLDRPVGQPSITDLCRGKLRPLVIIDDLNRPTPAARVFPLLLKRFREAGVAASSVTILVATGTHGPPSSDSVSRKIGPEAASTCKILVHDAKRNCVPAGYTSSGTPVLVNAALLASDFVMGIGGVYPNYTAGFGGGSKLALGVLGFRSIKTLHFRFHGAGWGQPKNAPLRRDLDEIARMIRLDTILSLHINADREVVRAVCGNHFLYHDNEVTFARQFFSVPMPQGADVVISNAYPSDLCLTAVLQKGTGPLRKADRNASRIVIASCTEGVGEHGLFPVIPPRHLPLLQLVRRISVMDAHELTHAVARRLWRRKRGPSVPRRSEKANPIWFYRPVSRVENLPSEIPGYRVVNSWPGIVAGIEREQGTGRNLKVFIYPCAPLQILR